MSVGRNDPCPCGSGKRYKSCCSNKGQKVSRFTLMALGIGGAVAVLLIVLAMQMKGPAGGVAPVAGTSTSVPVGGAPTPQPPGEAPPGKVWSPEHGHWHDVPATGTMPVPVGTPPAPAETAPATGGQ